MLGAIIGDILGHPYESWQFKAQSKNINLFSSLCDITDDSILTISIADSLLNNIPYHENLKKWTKKYPNYGYGSGFYEWVESNDYYIMNSYSNGCAMRISPIAYAFDTIEKLKEEINKTIYYTHNTQEAFNGTFAVALSILLARKSFSKDQIKQFIKDNLNNQHYQNFNLTIDDIKLWDKQTTRCNITIPQALICFFESTDFEDCIRNAIYSEGDCDTVASISGAIAEAYYRKIPVSLINFCTNKIPLEFQKIIVDFKNKYKFSNY